MSLGASSWPGGRGRNAGSERGTNRGNIGRLSRTRSGIEGVPFKRHGTGGASRRDLRLLLLGDAD